MQRVGVEKQIKLLSSSVAPPITINPLDGSCAGCWGVLSQHFRARCSNSHPSDSSAPEQPSPVARQRTARLVQLNSLSKVVRQR